MLATRVSGHRELGQVLLAALAKTGRADRHTHGFHTYPAGLHPDAARDLVGALPGARVHDPFCGGGTVLIEAMLAGRRATGTDVSEVAVRVATTRTRRTTEAERTRFRSVARSLTADAQRVAGEVPAEVLPLLVDWYEPHVLGELAAIRAGIVAADVDDRVRQLLWTTWSSILIKVSHRRSDTSAARVEVSRAPATTAVLFHKKARELGRRLESFEAALPLGLPEADVSLADARDPGPPASVDLVVTSPPYPSVYDYLPMQSLREIWLGVRSDAQAEIGSRRTWRHEGAEAVRRWEADTGLWMAAVAARLTRGGHLAVIIGDGLVGGATISADLATGMAAEAAGLRPVALASAARPDHARDAVRWEHAMLFRRP